MISVTLIFFLSLPRPPPILHQLSTSGTPGGLISAVSPPSWAHSAPSYLHYPRSELWSWISPSPFRSPLFRTYHLHRWPLAPRWLQGSLPLAPGSMESTAIWHSAHSPSRQPMRPARGVLSGVFSWLALHILTDPDLLLVSSSKATPRSF